MCNATTSNDNTSITSWNCRSISHFLGDYINGGRQADILCLQETGLKSDSKKKRKQKLRHPDYQPAIRVDCEEGKSRGVAILVKKGIDYDELGKGVNDWGEYITIAIRKKGQPTLHVSNIYVHHHPKKELDLDNLLSLAEYNHIITGDMNAHNPIWGSRIPNARGKLIERQMLELGLKCMNSKEITRVSNDTRQGNTSIDLSLITEINDLGDIFWDIDENSFGSDHLPQQITVGKCYDAEPIPPQLLRYNTLKMKTKDWDAYKTELEKVDWAKVRTGTDIQKLRNLEKEIHTVGKQIIPNNGKQLGKTPKPRKQETMCNKSWWSPECEQARDETRRLQKIWIRRKQIRKQMHPNHYQKDENEENDLINYRKARNIYTSIKNKARSEAFNDHVNGLNPNSKPRETWRTLNAIDGKQVKHSQVAPLKNLEGKTITGDQEKANILASHYYQVSSNANLDKEYLEDKGKRKEQAEKAREKKPPDDQDYNGPIKIEEVEDALKTKTETSPGEDTITYKMLEYLPKPGTEVLTEIIDGLYREGPLPPDFKTAIITPVPKPDKDPQNPASYRPISLTSHIAKLMETIVNKRLKNYLESKNIITKNQSGFRTRREATEQVLALETAIRTANLGRKTRVIGIFLDLERAFDICDRDLVLELLDKYGVSGSMYNYILDFMTDRTFKVKIGNALSDLKIQENGVPQGSVLSPTLFGIAVNEVDKQLKDEKTNIGQYADDISIYREVHYFKNKNSEKCLKALSNEATRVVQYLKKRGFRVNTTKTQAVYFGTKNEAKLKIDGQEIETQKEAKYLGITLDKELKYKTHITNKIKEGNRTMNLLHLIGKKLKKNTTRILKPIYKCLIEARIAYGETLYMHGDAQLLTTLDRLHTKAQRIMTRAIKTTPKYALEALTGEPPPDVKRQINQLSLWARIHTNKNNDIGKKIDTQATKFQNSHKFKTTKNIQRGAARNIKKNADMLDLTPDMITTIEHHPCPHTWAKLDIDTHLTAQISKKKDTIEKMKLVTTQHIEEKYKNIDKIYTDGSRDAGLTGLGVYSEDLNISKHERTTDHAAIATVEMTAILVALETIIETKETDETVILTDSLSALLALKTADPRNKRYDIITKIMSAHEEIIKAKSKVTFCWVPSHVDLTGNDKADELAKKATQKSDIDINIKLGTNEFKAIIKARARKLIWDNHWSENKSITKTLIPSIMQNKIPYGKGIYERKNRLIMGAPIFLYARKFDTILCEKCPEKTEKTIEHVLLECPAHARQRERLKATYDKKDVVFNIFNLLAPGGDKSVRWDNLNYINRLNELI